MARRRWVGLGAGLAVLLVVILLLSGRGKVDLDPEVQVGGLPYGAVVEPRGLCRPPVGYQFCTGTVTLTPLEPDPKSQAGGTREVSFTPGGDMWTAARYHNLPRGRKYRLRLDTKVVPVILPGGPTAGPSAEAVVVID